VLLRIDSTGGDALAAAAIWRDVQLTRRSGKPVVASLGTYAASGGYMIATAADVIVAQPGTVTGSIGVLVAKLDLSRWLRRQGIYVHELAAGAEQPSFSRGLTRAQRRQVEAMADEVYDDFCAKVESGRALSRRHVRRHARGRVWTGEQAWRRGLVDELGGIHVALSLAAARAGVESGAKVRHVDFAAKPAGVLGALGGKDDAPLGAAIGALSAALGSALLSAIGPELYPALHAIAMAERTSEISDSPNVAKMTARCFIITATARSTEPVGPCSASRWP